MILPILLPLTTRLSAVPSLLRASHAGNRTPYPTVSAPGAGESGSRA
ncbi:MAG: hypothetical protein VB034_11530 [Eubacteriales bacterium]|nr:hypothetical protein [Eubacteriales bacterium]